MAYKLDSSSPINLGFYSVWYICIAVLNKMRYTPLATDAVCPREHLVLLRKAIVSGVPKIGDISATPKNPDLTT
jgi:hypothetical protein